MDQLIAEKRAELDALVTQAESMREEQRLTAIATARNLMRAFELTLDEVLEHTPLAPSGPVRRRIRARDAEANAQRPQSGAQASLPEIPPAPQDGPKAP